MPAATTPDPRRLNRAPDSPDFVQPQAGSGEVPSPGSLPPAPGEAPAPAPPPAVPPGEESPPVRLPGNPGPPERVAGARARCFRDAEACRASGPIRALSTCGGGG
jgi:hypothetical protein